MTRILAVLVLLASGLCHGAIAQTADPALVEQGRHLATAGDCAACHGETSAGGKAIASPIGDIYASNITPDPTGIGGWTLSEFSDLMRKGIAPDEHIFPAMPYTSYTGLTDDQIAALYSYFRFGVDPVANVPPETELPFPFVRPAMIGWNALFLDAGRASGAVDVSGAQLEKGRTLVESLGHCSACHTPRGALMEEKSDRHLAGALVDGWWAPNLTPDATGLGGWSDDDIATFLTTGHTDMAVAAGEMGTVVSLSTSRLPREDIDAMVAYLRAVPAVASDVPVRRAEGEAAPLDIASAEPAGEIGWAMMLGQDSTDGATLYRNACASCHRLDGNGSANLRHPSLRLLESVRGPDGATLVQVIAGGVNRQAGDTQVLMPGFRHSLDDAQIASLANYVRTEFGGIDSDVPVSDIASLLDGSIGTPWIIANATWLSIAGLVGGAVLAILLLGWFFLRRRRQPRQRSA